MRDRILHQKLMMVKFLSLEVEWEYNINTPVWVINSTDKVPLVEAALWSSLLEDGASIKIQRISYRSARMVT